MRMRIVAVKIDANDDNNDVMEDQFSYFLVHRHFQRNSISFRFLMIPFSTWALRIRA